MRNMKNKAGFMRGVNVVDFLASDEEVELQYKGRIFRRVVYCVNQGDLVCYQDSRALDESRTERYPIDKIKIRRIDPTVLAAGEAAWKTPWE